MKQHTIYQNPRITNALHFKVSTLVPSYVLCKFCIFIAHTKNIFSLYVVIMNAICLLLHTWLKDTYDWLVSLWLTWQREQGITSTHRATWNSNSINLVFRNISNLINHICLSLKNMAVKLKRRKFFRAPAMSSAHIQTGEWEKQGLVMCSVVTTMKEHSCIIRLV